MKTTFQLRRILLSALVALAMAPSSPANVIISISGVGPTTGLPSSFSTYTLSANSDFGSIVGFDFATSANFGLFGTMNQVNPSGLPTVFTDNNAAIASVAHVSQDSQFLFNTANLVVLPGSASEGSNSLKAAFASFVPFYEPEPASSVLVGIAAAVAFSLIRRRSSVSQFGVAH